MDISALLDFIETHCEEICTTIELKNLLQHDRRRGRPLRLVFDAEPCLVFFYGAQAGDWVSGGQWNSMVRFLQTFLETCSRCNMEATVFFNGTSVRERYSQWCENQLSCSRHIQDIARIIRTKAFHPPKALWVAPCGLTSVLRLALNHIGVPTVASYRDHHLEMVSFARENGFDGIVSWDADLIMFHAPPRYFSARELFLSYNWTISAVEVDVDAFARFIDLHPSRFCILATLLGNHIMPAAQLQEFYGRICCLSSSIHVVQYPSVEKIRAVIQFLRKLPSIDDLNEVAKAVFGNESVKSQAAEHFKKSVEYYRRGREAGLSPNCSFSLSPDSRDSYSSPKPSNSGTSLILNDSRIPGDGVDKEFRYSSAPRSDLRYSINCIRMAIPPPPPLHQHSAPSSQTLLLGGGWDEELESVCKPESKGPERKSEVAFKSRSLMDYTTLFGAGGYSTHGPSCNSSTSSASQHPLSSPIPKWWKVAPEVLKLARERHQKALMMPWVYQILTHGEIFLPPLLEDDKDMSLARAIDLFRPLRQRVYSVLLERNSERISDSDAVVREWSILHASSTPLPTFNVVEVPAASSTLLNMWFGMTQDDIVLRNQSFLDCFGCIPIQHLLLKKTNIKPHFLVLCCVLRYLVIQKSIQIADESVIQGFLATAVSNLLHEPKAIRELNIPVMSMRSIQLATIFMHGLENALFANEAFGSPLPIDLFCPSQYFDGKLFHYKMAKIGQKASLAELCENSLEQQMYVERMQSVIVSSLPKDCAYSNPFLWNKSAVPEADHGFGLGPPPRGQGSLPRDQGSLPRDQGSLPRAQGPYGNFPGRRGRPSHLNSFSREIVCQPAGISGIPFPDEKRYVALLDAPPSRVTRGDSRTRHSRGRQRNAGNKRGRVTSNVVPAQRESRPSSRGHQPITATARRGAIGHRSEVIASISIAPSYGRGRGCTVEMDVPNSSEVPPITLGIEASAKKWIGRGRGLSSRPTDTKVGLQQQQQRTTVSTMLHLADATDSRPSHHLQQSDDLTQIVDADGDHMARNQNGADSKEQECKRTVVTSPEDDIFLSMPQLMEKSNVHCAGERWSNIVEAEELLLLSKLTVEENESNLVMPSNEARHELDQISEGGPLQCGNQLTDSSRNPESTE